MFGDITITTCKEGTGGGS